MRDKAYKLAWQRNKRRAFVEMNGYSSSADCATGGNRQAVLERDEFACVRCGMTDAEHKERWGRPITVDHINKDRSDNRLENLQTLCLRCHAIKDTAPLNRGRAWIPEHQELIMVMRSEGATIEEIAEAVGCVPSALLPWFDRWGLRRGKRGQRCQKS